MASFFLFSSETSAQIRESFEESQAIRKYIDQKLFDEGHWRDFIVRPPLEDRVFIVGQRLRGNFLRPLFDGRHQTILDAVQHHYFSEEPVEGSSDSRLVALFGPKIRDRLRMAISSGALVLSDTEAEGSEILIRETLRALDVFALAEGNGRETEPSRIHREYLGAPISRLHDVLGIHLRLPVDGDESRILEPFLVYEEEEALRVFRTGEAFQRLADTIYAHEHLRKDLEESYWFRAESARTPKFLRVVYEAFVDLISANVPEGFVWNVGDRLIRQREGLEPRLSERRYIDAAWRKLDLSTETPRMDDRRELTEENAVRILDQVFSDIERYIDPEGRLLFSNRSFFLRTDNVLRIETEARPRILALHTTGDLTRYRRGPWDRRGSAETQRHRKPQQRRLPRRSRARR